MIDVEHTWLPQIIGYAELIVDEEKFKSCWLQGQCPHTSVTNYDELMEQIFGDLDTDNIIQSGFEETNIPKTTLDLVIPFINALHNVDSKQEAGIYTTVAELLDSAEWRQVINTAIPLAKVV